MFAEIPEKLGRYEIRQVIGRGAMGMVYLAFDPLIERSVAIKVVRIPPWMSDDDVKLYHARFFQEAKAAGRLHHSNIVTVFDMGVDEETHTPYIVMEYIEGYNLKSRLINEGSIPWEELLLIIYQVALALAYAHNQGIVHRDIKPANIMLASDRVLLGDFGIAHLPQSDMTERGQLLGSPSYMSPEQAMGQPATPLSDLFSLGVVVYECLAGQKPFDGDTFSQISYKVINEPPPDLRMLRPDLPKNVIDLVESLLQKNTTQRMPDATTLARRIVEIFEAHGRPIPKMLNSLDTLNSGIQKEISGYAPIHDERTHPLIQQQLLPFSFLNPRNWNPLTTVALGALIFGLGFVAFGIAPLNLSQGTPPLPRVSSLTFTVTAPPLPPKQDWAVPPSKPMDQPVSSNPQPIPKIKKCNVSMIVNHPFLSLQMRIDRDDILLAETVLVPQKKTILGPIKRLIGESTFRFSVEDGVNQLKLNMHTEGFSKIQRVSVTCRQGRPSWIRLTIDKETHQVTTLWGPSAP